METKIRLIFDITINEEGEIQYTTQQKGKGNKILNDLDLMNFLDTARYNIVMSFINEISNYKEKINQLEHPEEYEEIT